MATRVKLAKRVLIVLLATAVSAAAQQDTALIFGKPGKPGRASYRIKFSSGLRDARGTLRFEPGQVTIRDEKQTVVETIADGRLISAVATTRGRQMPFVRLSAAFESSEDPREAAMMLATAIAWDAAMGAISLFHRPHHYVTVTFLQDDDMRSETLQVSGKDARKLVDALQARHAATVPDAQ